MGTGLVRQVAAVVVVAGVCVGGALGASSTALPTLKVSPESPLAADIVVSSKGFTLYHYLKEAKGTIKCIGSCTVLWPPLVIPAGAKPVAGPGLDARKLGTIKRPDGRTQVTYNGLALYRDVYDKFGQANGQGQDRLWFAVTPAGTVTKARAAAPVAASASTPAASPQQPASGSPGGGDGGAGGCVMQQVIDDNYTCPGG
jgi:predicted lipoprotein with Yx(FWY)xxD motif